MKTKQYISPESKILLAGLQLMVGLPASDPGNGEWETGKAPRKISGKTV